ncbi:zinc finger and SCAN domain-containing protein 23-like isoform X1 [Thamnophis elegans]|uniref:zinc finger and SCAN domain-containing protein 23-like isoform X1 n=1 Tax=Thamnophis elegans TaxID=35005 RepID=UPI00137767AE|nr:zinc finger and SCAN domain-containing protein 23-like isoform X1 [Thamnophis elegans]XP_032091068.1 zinc finger and SCAN domain-containing protein 23-like isoform X1 [Thamnophis elegans]XP_032091069.1 zinc finger and SCAN domain-containing protein 23-like isoform X1 [Thamnophis elegans]XP_032091070.1 zinc finger and SCAN domain-containing protein 23-like isoform X1 [Thamnophis elegans]XP_032091071.1 zinc finger and SCAN domain-containing protein 23-like isoform X1 [Thamnophis elegans]
MEKSSPPVGTIKEFLNCSPSWKDRVDLNGMVVKPQYWEVWQQVLLPSPQHKETDASPPKIMLDDIQVCVVSSENSPDSFKEKEANTEGKVGIDCVITIEEEIEVQGKSSPESRIELRDDIKICTVPELQDEAALMATDGGKTKDFTKPVKGRGFSKVEKATQTEVTQMEMTKICEDYIQKAEGSKDTLRGNHQANVVSQNKPRDSEEGMIHLTEPDRIGELEEAACNNLTAGEEEEVTSILKEGGIAMESARQSFRWYCYPEGEGPRKAYRQLLDLCHHWLKPERRSKEQILELLVLEQFLATLPKEIQNWVWQQHPESCGQAVELVENFLTGLSLLERHGKKALVTFEEVSMYFSEEEWRLLDESQRKIFTKVMMENYENVRELGFPTNNPDLVFKMGRNKNNELYMDKIQNLEEGASPEVTGELEFSNEKEKLATRTQKDMKDVLPSRPTSPRPLKSCDATVKGHSPRRQRARSLLQQTMPGFACPDCGKKFFSNSDMARHQWHHARKQSYQHGSCPKSFAKPSQLAQQQHRQPGECQCSKCGKRFTDDFGLARHQAIHSAKRPFHRHHRGFYFNYNLRQNQNQPATTADSLFHCPDCGRQFTRRCNLIQHSRIHQWQPQGKQEVLLYPGGQTQ